MGDYSDVSQPERLIFILMLLSENSHPFSIAQIHEKVCAYGANVDERTIRRDIDLLSEIAYITEEESGRQPTTPAVSLTLRALPLTAATL